jgi:hypothetical protein
MTDAEDEVLELHLRERLEEARLGRSGRGSHHHDPVTFLLGRLEQQVEVEVGALLRFASSGGLGMAVVGK